GGAAAGRRSVPPRAPGVPSGPGANEVRQGIEGGPSALLAHACDALYRRIVRTDKILVATQYFRTRWVPLLGPTRAWLILHLRARCYLNARQLEVRDTCT